MRIGLILPCRLSEPLPSTRVQLINVMPLLRQRGFECVVVHETSPPSEQPDELPEVAEVLRRGVNIVIFQKVYGPAAQRLAKDLRTKGVKTIFMVCDRIVTSMAAATDVTLTVTEHLASLYPQDLRHRLQVVHDGIERIDVRKAVYRPDAGSLRRPLRAVVVTSARLDHIPVLGMPPPWLQVVVVGDYPAPEQWGRSIRAHWYAWRRETALQRLAHLKSLCNPRIQFRRWTPDGVYRELLDADIAMIPVERDPPLSAHDPAPAWSVKSENRLTLKMAVGLPVVASPVPSYGPLLADSTCGLLAEDRQAWLCALESLRDPIRRQAMGRQARERVVRSFSLEHQARRLGAVLRRLAVDGGPVSISSGAVDIHG